eukprot:scaffold656986_cov66-Prasinocladus_malaysianus.AAC.1
MGGNLAGHMAIVRLSVYAPICAGRAKARPHYIQNPRDPRVSMACDGGHTCGGSRGGCWSVCCPGEIG